MSKARDRSSRSGSDPIQIGSTKLVTDSNNDLTVQDTSNNTKKLIASEVHIGTGSDKVILKRSSSDGKLQLQTTDGSSTTDSEVSSDSSSGSGTTVYADIATMVAVSSPSAGSQALVTANKGLYIFNGSGWYKIATVNTTPSLVSPASGTDVTMSSEGTATTIELVATDADEGTILQYSYSVSSGSLTNGGGTTATVTSSATSDGTYSALAAGASTTNRFIKISPSTNANYAGNFSLNFSISDGTNAATTLQNFSLAFTVSGSLYFDGTGDYILTSESNNLVLGTGDFTIEYWVNSPIDKVQLMVDRRKSGSTEDIVINNNTDGTVRFYANGAYRITSSATTSNVWNHIALVRASNVTKLYINGVADSETFSDNTNYSSNQVHIAKHYDHTDYSTKGYISNYREVVGTAVYTNNFTPPTSPLSPITNTKLLVAKNPTPVYASSGSYLFNANAENLLVTHADMSMGSGNWTVDFWFKFPVIPDSNNWFFGAGTANSDALQMSYYKNANQINFQSLTGSAAAVLTNFGSELNTWYHIRFCRHGNNHYCFINGNCISNTGSIITTGQSYTVSYTHAPSTSQWRIGGEMSGNYGWDNGMLLSDFRIIKGTALQTSAASFSIPTTPSTAVSGTVLLTAQGDSNVLTDNSGTSKTITMPQGTVTADSRKAEIITTDESGLANQLTINGDTVFHYATPFEDAGGGSVYFSGNSNNVLKTGSNADFTLGTGDFTIEGWVYLLSGSDNNGFWQVGGNNSNGFGTNYTSSVSLVMASATTLKLYGAGGEYQLGVANAAVANTWVHYAMTRTSNTIRIYKNGTEIYSRSDTRNYSGSYLGLGAAYGPEQTPNIYISNFRLVKGTCVYTGNFAAPTGNLTPTGGTYSSTTNVNTSIPSGHCSVLTAVKSNSFADISGNNHTITQVGDPIATKFMPF